ncbi:hypothetical protein RSOLAG22IIIB_06608 [Rhizoctonia solani]|uniref:CHAT domain-containing protein n=1 Tax=Rhizoctonia solani TaxID=456999 RepID=A0A0K6GF68_9AGAM|nr:hypothetical protein RSOLAG22IIIB_06608 [Rhizoctonia solani]
MNQALKFTNSNDFHWPLRLKNLGLCYWTQFCRVPGRSESLDNAVNYLREAATSAFGSPQLKLSAALEWGRIAAQHSHASDPIPAYQVALSLITEVAWLGNTVEKRYIGLHKVRELAMEAAAVAIDVDKYALALEWLEQARSVVWNQDLQLRSPVDELTSKHPVLAQEFTSISSELLRVGNGSQESHISKSSVAAKEEAAQRHRRLAESYAALLSRIRKLDGFENFMRVNIDAALSKSGVRERGFSRQSMIKGKANHFETTLATLWNNLAKPVLDLLGYTNDTRSGQLPHITWCLTGPLSFLPVHAAGYYDRPGAKLSDFAVSSYAPTIGALLAAKASSSEFISSILAVGQSESPGHDLKPLPGATIELANIQRHVAKLSQHTELVGGKATPMAVLNEMKHHNSVHFACHARQNVTDPNKSGFFLHEGELALTSIRKEHFENKGLAFLSACQTATGDKELPDEAVHLASGMLMAGFPSVVATMWSVVDDDAPFVVDRFYKELSKDGVMRTDQVARALHYATQALREKVKEDGGSGDRWFSRWVPYIHIGM